MKGLFWRKSYVYLGVAAAFLAPAGIMFAVAPDTLSTAILGLMCFTLVIGYFAGLMPTIQYVQGFRRCRAKIEESMAIQTTEPWIAVFKTENIFGIRTLDEAFRLYKGAIEEERENDEYLSDIEEYISEEYLALRAWRGLVQQVPGTLTGLGILGTFIGLVLGIGSITFTTIETALASINQLIAGIEMAFFTSICGVILSIIFNMVSQIVWNVMMREYGLFMDSYHKLVIPAVEVQKRKKTSENMKAILERLDRLPKNPGFSLSHGGSGQSDTFSNEQVLMSQIVTGLQRGEFTFFLQPAVELATRKVVRAEALVRWNHETLGILPPSSFVPVLEKNAYITKLDMYVWEAVCQTIRRWIDAGVRPVPISINLSRTDIMAMDLAPFFEGMLKKYRIPPRFLELEIAQNAYRDNPGMVSEVAGALRQMGFKVVMDGFDGDFIAINMLKGVEIDALKLDIRFMKGNALNSFPELFGQAKKLGIDMSVEGIENTEQITNLRKAGCSVGQGYYFYTPMSIEDFEKITE